jgi:cyclopropane fatty-acyl-phospholipid synthase-like methyltransferase
MDEPLPAPDASAVTSRAPDLTRIRAYYDATWLDYRLLWLNRRNRAIHFGYWDAHTTSHAESLVNLNHVLARQIGIRPGQRVLDAGCGVGGSALWLAETYGVEVVGITPVPGQVARARRYAQARGVADRVSFDTQDYLHTSFPTASFDVVWAIESVCHAPDKPRFFAEARRLLRPGGRLGMVEYLRTIRPAPPTDEALLRRWLSGWAIPDLMTADELRAWAGAANFQEIQLINITRNVAPSLHRLYRMATLLWPVAIVLAALRLRSVIQHGNQRGAREQYRALRRGLWGEYLVTATAAQPGSP